VPAEPSPAEGLRERKKRQRRDALIDAAQALVLERGLDAVTVDDVCAAVGVSTRTFFNYCPSKDDAVLGLEDLSIPEAAAARFVDDGPTGVLLDDLEALVAELLVNQGMSPERVHCALRIVEREPRLIARHVSWVEGHRTELLALFTARREVHPYVPDPELLVLVVMTLLRTSTLAWERGDRAGRPVDHLPDVVAQLRALLGPAT
jgi:AcrR family transcriptional regulator